MRPFSAKSAVRQLVDHLREEILSGALGEKFSGINQLVRELGVGTETVVAVCSTIQASGLSHPKTSPKDARRNPQDPAGNENSHGSQSSRSDF